MSNEAKREAGEEGKRLIGLLKRCDSALTEHHSMEYWNEEHAMRHNNECPICSSRKIFSDIRSAVDLVASLEKRLEEAEAIARRYREEMPKIKARVMGIDVATSAWFDKTANKHEVQNEVTQVISLLTSLNEILDTTPPAAEPQRDPSWPANYDPKVHDGDWNTPEQRPGCARITLGKVLEISPTGAQAVSIYGLDYAISQIGSGDWVKNQWPIPQQTPAVEEGKAEGLKKKIFAAASGYVPNGFEEEATAAILSAIQPEIERMERERGTLKNEVERWKQLAMAGVKASKDLESRIAQGWTPDDKAVLRGTVEDQETLIQQDKEQLQSQLSSKSELVGKLVEAISSSNELLASIWHGDWYEDAKKRVADNDSVLAEAKAVQS